jgi:hypothetical protein
LLQGDRSKSLQSPDVQQLLNIEASAGPDRYAHELREQFLSPADWV